ncbi:MAG: AAA family ATPase [Methanospirillum sp.]|nr:AAA family ATPase [Methanospirillum sp.]
MLWIEKYRPGDFSGIVGQDRAIAFLSSVVGQQTIPHLLLTGPGGSGRMSTVRCLAAALYGEHADENTTVIATGDLFNEGRAYLQGDARFSHLYRKDESLIANVKRIIKTYAAIRPFDTGFKLMVFQEADAMPGELQQALRRTMERYSRTCRFIMITSRQSAILPSIASRCFPVVFRPVPTGTVASLLREILRTEGAEPIPDDDLAMIAASARGDVRRAIMMLELTVSSGAPPPFDAFEVSRAERGASGVLSRLREGDLAGAQRLAQSLMIEDGLTGRDLLIELRRAVWRGDADPELAIAIAETDSRFAQGAGESVQIGALLAQVPEVCR